MFDNTGGGGLVEIEKLPYLVVSTTPKIKRGMPWKARRKENPAREKRGKTRKRTDSVADI